MGRDALIFEALYAITNHLAHQSQPGNKECREIAEKLKKKLDK